MLRTVTPATADPISLDEAKRHLRIDFADDDDLITALISAATLQAQGLTQRRFVTQTVEWVLDGWRPTIHLPIAPVKKDGVVSITYIDWTTQAPVVLDPSLYVVQTRGHSVGIIPKFATIWPIVFPYSPEPVVIQFNVGAAPAAVPGNVKAAIKLIVGHLYENRQAVIIDAARVTAVELPQGVEALLMDELW
jgi:uncharacterized phiE125 gp8 family phage protein